MARHQSVEAYLVDVHVPAETVSDRCAEPADEVERTRGEPTSKQISRFERRCAATGQEQDVPDRIKDLGKQQ